MKKLYTFTVLKEEEIEKEETSTNEAGDTVVIKKKVKEDVPHKFFIRKPTRSLYESAELFHGGEVAKALSSGMMTRAQLDKRFINDGGILSEPERKNYSDLLVGWKDKSIEYQKLSLKSAAELTIEEKTKLDKLVEELITINEKLQSFQLEREEFFASTAETWARNRTVVWWLLFLSYFDDEKPFIDGVDFNEKIAKYDEILDGNDEFKNKVLSRFSYFITLWFMGRANTEEDFTLFDKQLIASQVQKPNE